LVKFIEKEENFEKKLKIFEEECKKEEIDNCK
jgi:hypothetical protein